MALCSSSQRTRQPCQEGKCAEYHSTSLSPTLGHNIPASAKPLPHSSHPALTQLLPTAYCTPNDWRAPPFFCPKSVLKCAHNTYPRKSQTHPTNYPELLQSLPFISLNFLPHPFSKLLSLPLPLPSRSGPLPFPADCGVCPENTLFDLGTHCELGPRHAAQSGLNKASSSPAGLLSSLRVHHPRS